MADETTKHVIQITADTSQADDALESSAQKLDNVDQEGQKVSRTFANLGGKIAAAFKNSGLSNFGKDLSDAAKSANIGDRMAAAAKEASDLVKTMTGIKIPAKAASDAKTLRDNVEGVGKAMQDLAGQRIPTEEYAKVSAALDKVNAKIDSYVAKQQKLKATHNIEDTEKWQALNAQIDAATDAANRMWQQRRQMERDGSQYDASYQAVAMYLARAEVSMAKLTARQDELRAGGKMMSDEWRQIGLEIGTLSQNIGAYKSQLAIARESGTAYSAEYTRLSEEIDKAAQAIDELYAKQEQLRATRGVENSQAWKSLQYDIDQARAKAEQYRATMESMESDGTAYRVNVDTSSVDDVGGRLSDSISAVMPALSKLMPSLSSAISKFGEIGAVGSSAFGGVAGAALYAAGTIAKSFGSLVLKGVKKLGSGLAGLAKNFLSARKAAKQTDSVIEKARKTFLSFFTMLKSRAKEAIITTVWQTMRDSIGDIANVADRFNTSISGMIDSVKAFGAQLMAIAEPIVTVLGPYVSKIVDVLTSGADTLAQFTARLTGQTTYVKATKGQSDYAASVRETEKNTKDADKAAKEYKRTLLGFDQINRMDAIDTDDAAEAVGIDDAQLRMAETKATRLNRLADKIYNAFKSNNFKAAGEAVSEGINEAFAWLKNVAGWEANSQRVTSTLRGVIDFINGLTYGFNPTLVGDAVGDVINTIINSFKILTDPDTGIDFKAIGHNIGESVRSALATIDWTAAGNAFTQSIQGLVSLLNGIISTEGFWTTIGDSIANLLGGAVDSFDPGLIGNALANLVNGISDAIIAIFGSEEKRQKMSELGTKMAEALNTAIDSIDMDKLETAIRDLVAAIAELLGSAIKTFDWSGLGELLWQVLKTAADAAWYELTKRSIQEAAYASVTDTSKTPSDVSKKAQSAVQSTTTDSKRQQAYTDTVTSGSNAKQSSNMQKYANAVVSSESGSGESKGILGSIGSALSSLVDKLSPFKKATQSDVSSIVSSNKAGSGYIIQPIDPDKLRRIRGYASGGIVGDGQLFIANEDGAELIGSDGRGNTAIVNNNQIISAVVSGVRQAMMEVMMTMSKGNDSNGGDIVLMVDSEELARATIKGQRKIDKRYNPGVSFA